MSLFDFPGDRNVTIILPYGYRSSNNGQDSEVSFGFHKDKLQFFPDMKACALQLFNVMVINPDIYFILKSAGDLKLNRFISVDKLHINFYVAENRLTTTWDDENPPPEFLAFQQEFNQLRDRLFKIKVFW